MCIFLSLLVILIVVGFGFMMVREQYRTPTGHKPHHEKFTAEQLAAMDAELPPETETYRAQLTAGSFPANDLIWIGNNLGDCRWDIFTHWWQFTDDGIQIDPACNPNSNLEVNLYRLAGPSMQPIHFQNTGNAPAILLDRPIFTGDYQQTDGTPSCMGLLKPWESCWILVIGKSTTNRPLQGTVTIRAKRGGSATIQLYGKADFSITKMQDMQ